MYCTCHRNLQGRAYERQNGVSAAAPVCCGSINAAQIGCCVTACKVVSCELGLGYEWCSTRTYKPFQTMHCTTGTCKECKAKEVVVYWCADTARLTTRQHVEADTHSIKNFVPAGGDTAVSGLQQTAYVIRATGTNFLLLMYGMWHSHARTSEWQARSGPGAGTSCTQ